MLIRYNTIFSVHYDILRKYKCNIQTVGHERFEIEFIKTCVNIHKVPNAHIIFPKWDTILNPTDNVVNVVFWIGSEKF